MRFKTFQLIIDGHNPKDKELNDVILYGKDKHEQRKEIYLIDRKMIDNKYLWMYCQHDDAKLYGDIVFDTEKEKKHKNTRKRNEIELRKQLFVVYDIDAKLLFLNDMTKKSFVKEYIADALQVDVGVKNIYASLEEFQESVKSLTRLKFTQIYNIQNTIDEQSLFVKQVNELGLDMPDRMMMQIDYPNTPIGMIRAGLQNIKRKRDAGYFKDIILVGLDDLGVEQSFDFSSIIKNLDISVLKKENERYDEQEVERALLFELRKQNVRKA